MSGDTLILISASRLYLRMMPIIDFCDLHVFDVAVLVVFCEQHRSSSRKPAKVERSPACRGFFGWRSVVHVLVPLIIGSPASPVGCR